MAPFDPEETIGLNFFESPITKALSISTKNKLTVVNPGEDKTHVKLKPATGLFTGTFRASGETKKSSFGGVIYQKSPDPRGEGFYQQGTTSERVLLARPR